MKVDVSIVIVAYRSQSVIFDCLNSVDEFNDLKGRLEVIIVDNSPDDDLEKELESYDAETYKLKYIHNPENGGFGQGNNIGVNNTSGDILLFLNPDTILLEPIFESLIRTMSNSTVSAAGFRLVDVNGIDNDTVGIYPELNYIYLPRKLLNYLVVELGILTSIVYPWGADFCVRRKDFVKAGLFDENMFLCNEEPDLMKRLDFQNVKIINKKIIHLEGHTTAVKAERFRAWLDSTSYYLDKHGFSYKRFLYIFLFRNFAKKTIKRLMGRESAKEAEVHKMLLSEINSRGYN